MLFSSAFVCLIPKKLIKFFVQSTKFFPILGFVNQFFTIWLENPGENPEMQALVVDLFYEISQTLCKYLNSDMVYIKLLNQISSLSPRGAYVCHPEKLKVSHC